jgi:hypothetical protein
LGAGPLRISPQGERNSSGMHVVGRVSDFAPPL